MTNTAKYNYIVSKMNAIFEKHIPEKDRKAIEDGSYGFGFFNFKIRDSYYYYKNYIKDKEDIKNSSEIEYFVDTNGEVQTMRGLTNVNTIAFVTFYASVYKHITGQELDITSLEIELSDEQNRTIKTYLLDSWVSSANAVTLAKRLSGVKRLEESRKAIQSGKEDNASRNVYIKGLISALESSMTSMLDLFKGGANERATKIRTKFTEAIKKKYGAKLQNKSILDPILIFENPDGSTFVVKYDEHINSTDNFVTNLANSLGEFGGTAFGALVGGNVGAMIGALIGSIGDTALKAYRYDFELDKEDYLNKGLESVLLSGAMMGVGKIIQTIAKTPGAKQVITDLLEKLPKGKVMTKAKEVIGKIFNFNKMPDAKPMPNGKVINSNGIASSVKTEAKPIVPKLPSGVKSEAKPMSSTALSSAKSESKGTIVTNMDKVKSKMGDKDFVKNYRPKKGKVGGKDRRTNRTGRERLKKADDVKDEVLPNPKASVKTKPTGKPAGKPKSSLNTKPKGLKGKPPKKSMKARYKAMKAGMAKASISTMLKAYHDKTNTEKGGAGVRTYQFVPVVYQGKFYYVKFEDTNRASEVITKEKLKPIPHKGHIEEIPNIYIKSKTPYKELKKRMEEASKPESVKTDAPEAKKADVTKTKEEVKTEEAKASVTPDKVVPSTPAPLAEQEVEKSVKVINKDNSEVIDTQTPKRNDIKMTSSDKTKKAAL